MNDFPLTGIDKASIIKLGVLYSDGMPSFISNKCLFAG